MKTLIIHPKDESTNFLRGIYKDIQYKTIITGDCTYDDVIEEIKSHTRIMMMGHGCPIGLFGVNQFGKGRGLIIDKNTVEYLQGKENVFIWCNSDQFVIKHDLNGFYSGMFISEVSESVMCGFQNITQSEVSNSNYSFSSIVGKHINKPLNEVYDNVIYDYGVLCDTNPIIEYNHNRLYYKSKSIIEQTQREKNEKFINEEVIPFLVKYPKSKKLDSESVRGFHREWCLKKYEEHFGYPFV